MTLWKNCIVANQELYNYNAIGIYCTVELGIWQSSNTNDCTYFLSLHLSSYRRHTVHAYPCYVSLDINEKRIYKLANLQLPTLETCIAHSHVSRLNPTMVVHEYVTYMLNKTHLTHIHHATMCMTHVADLRSRLIHWRSCLKSRLFWLGNVT